MPTPDRRDPPPPVQPDLPVWRPIQARQRVWLLVLTLATVAGLTYLLQRPHQQLVAAKAARHAAACQGEAASRPADCPGARMPVMVVPASPVTPAAPR